MSILNAHIKGDTFCGLSCSLTKNDIPIDLTGVVIKSYFRFCSKTGKEVHKFSIGNGITVTDASNGEFNLLKDEILDWKVGKWYFDIEFTFPDGSVKSSNTEILNIVQDVTNG